ncbi:MAG: MerR family transcriptional regulator [Nitrospinaceae bacterium]
MSPTIPDKLFFKIGEVAEISGVEQHVLRYWEDEFDTLKPDKNRAGQRLYKRKDVELVLEIKRLLYREKFTIAGAKKKLKESKKKSQQMDIAFDRDTFVGWKKKVQKELRSILNIIDHGKP